MFYVPLTASFRKMCIIDSWAWSEIEKLGLESIAQGLDRAIQLKA